jgi:hypothetical protein
MSKVPVDFHDPQSVTKLICDRLLAGASPEALERYSLAGTSIRTRLPSGSGGPGRSLLVRRGVWTGYDSGVSAENTVRLVAYDSSDEGAFDQASWFHGQLLAYRGDTEVVSFRFSEGPRSGTDPDFDTPICAMTVRARMHPRIL